MVLAEERMPLNNQSWHIVNDLGFEFSRDSVTQTTSNPGNKVLDGLLPLLQQFLWLSTI